DQADAPVDLGPALGGLGVRGLQRVLLLIGRQMHQVVVRGAVDPAEPGQRRGAGGTAHPQGDLLPALERNGHAVPVARGALGDLVELGVGLQGRSSCASDSGARAWGLTTVRSRTWKGCGSSRDPESVTTAPYRRRPSDQVRSSARRSAPKGM